MFEFPYINSLVVRMTGMNYIAESLPCEVFEQNKKYKLLAHVDLLVRCRYFVDHMWIS